MRIKLWLTEGARMEALCRDPAELINALCLAQAEPAEFRELEKDRYSFLVPAEMAEQAKKIGRRCGAEVSIRRRRGLLHFLRRFRKRAYLLLIPLPFILCFLLLSTYLWQIDVTGNKSLSRSEILAALETVGVYPGVSGLRLDNPQIRSRMQEALSKLSWCTVQVRGSRALVVVRERRPAPNILDASLRREVAAAKTGTIDTVQVLEGKALIRRGDTVLQGQTLITGILTDRQEQQRLVHAMGKIMAWTWYETGAVLPLLAQEKAYTGGDRTLYSLKIGDLRLNFYNDSSIPWEYYDKMTTEKRAVLFGLPLPVSIQRTECRCYRLLDAVMGEEEGAALLEERLLSWLRRTAPEAELRETWFQREISEGCLCLRVLAECREDIAAEREIRPSS